MVALSSAESELYACVKGASEALGVMSILSDFGQRVHARVLADASAALAIIALKGLGKVRHIGTSFSWGQEITAKRENEFQKVRGEANFADLITKNLTREVMVRHSDALGMKKNRPRPLAASQVTHVYATGVAADRGRTHV